MEFINILRYELDKIDDIPIYEIEEVQDMVLSIEEGIKSTINNKDQVTDTEENINYKINQLINNYIYTLNSPTRSDLYLFKTIENMLKNPDIINTIVSTHNMKEYLEPDSKYFVYTSDMNENYKLLLKDIFSTFSKYIPEDIKIKLKNNTLNTSQKMLLQSDICKFIKNFYDEKYDSLIKDGYVKRIVNTSTVLDLTGMLPRNNNSNNSRLRNLNLTFLGFKYEDEDKNAKKQKVCITDLMQPEFLKQFSVDELIAMSAFYSNRLAKAVYYYNECLYVLYKTDLIKKVIENPNYSLTLTDEELANILTQYKFLQKTSNKFISYKEKRKEPFNDDGKKVIFSELNNPIIKESISNYSDLYSNEFKSSIPNYRNNYIHDLNESIILSSSTSFVYNMKNNSIESLLTMLIDKKKEINWGIILEDNYNVKSNNILIGVDIKEFNMPIKLHFPKEQIQNFLLNYTGKCVIPVYQGHNDMNVNSKYHSTQVLLKLSKEQRKLLREESNSISSNDPKYKFVQHIQWMSHPKRYPDFLLDKHGNFNRKYINLQTGKKFTEKEINGE